MQGKKLLLLHQCCAICSSPALDDLVHSYEVDGYWYNPNIEPQTENDSRRAALFDFNKIKGIKTYLDEMDVNPVPTGENKIFTPLRTPAPFRCIRCYRERIERAVRFAVSKGYKFFTTTLLSSPYQEHDLIRKIGEEASLKLGINFVYFDVRKNYYNGLDEIRKMCLYRQRYCGCLMSLNERNAAKLKKHTIMSATPQSHSVVIK